MPLRLHRASCRPLSIPEKNSFRFTTSRNRGAHNGRHREPLCANQRPPVAIDDAAAAPFLFLAKDNNVALGRCGIRACGIFTSVETGAMAISAIPDKPAIEIGTWAPRALAP